MRTSPSKRLEKYHSKHFQKIYSGLVINSDNVLERQWTRWNGVERPLLHRKEVIKYYFMDIQPHLFQLYQSGQNLCQETVMKVLWRQIPIHFCYTVTECLNIQYIKGFSSVKWNTIKMYLPLINKKLQNTTLSLIGNRTLTYRERDFFNPMKITESLIEISNFFATPNGLTRWKILRNQIYPRNCLQRATSPCWLKRRGSGTSGAERTVGRACRHQGNP